MKSYKGFTLIELLVVIAVIGVLAGAIIVMINPTAQLARARDAGRKSDLKQIRGALERYNIINGTYPVMGYWAYSTTSNWIPLLVTSGELKSVPVDPTSKGCGGGWPWGDNQTCYWYAYRSDGVVYDLVAHLESKSDQDRCELKQWIFIGSGVSWCAPGQYSNQVYAPSSAQ